MTPGVGAAGGSRRPTSQSSLTQSGGPDAAAQTLQQANLPPSQKTASTDKPSPAQAPAAASSRHSTVEEIKNIHLKIFEDLEKLDWDNIFSLYNQLADRDKQPLLYLLYKLLNSFKQIISYDVSGGSRGQLYESSDISSSDSFSGSPSLLLTLAYLQTFPPKDDSENMSDIFFEAFQDNELRNLKDKLVFLTEFISKATKNPDQLSNIEVCGIMLLFEIRCLKLHLEHHITTTTDTSEFKNLIIENILPKDGTYENLEWQDAFKCLFNLAIYLISKHSDDEERIKTLYSELKDTKLLYEAEKNRIEKINDSSTNQKKYQINLIHNLITEIILINKELSQSSTELHEIVESDTGTITSLQATIKSLQEEKQDLETRMPNLKATIEEKEKCIQTLTEKITMQEENITGLHLQLSKYQAGNDELLQENMLLSEEYKKLGNKESEAIEKLKVLQSQIEDLESQITIEKTKYNENVSLLRNQEKCIQNLTKEHDHLKEKLAEAKEKNKAQTAALQQKAVEIQQKADEIKELKRTIKESETNSSEMEQRHNDLKAQLAQKQEEVKAQNAKIKNLELTIKEFEASGASMEQHLNDLMVEFEQAEKKVNVQNDEIQHQAAEIETLQNENAEKNAELAQKKEEVKAQTAVLQQKAVEIQQKADEIKQKADEIEKLQHTIKLIKSSRDEVEQHLSKLKGDLEIATKENEQLSTQKTKDSLQAEIKIKNQDQTIKTLQNENAEKDTALQQRDAEIAKRDAELQQKAVEIHELRLTIEKSVTHNSGIEQELSDLMSEFEQVEVEVNIQNAKIKKQADKIEALTGLTESQITLIKSLKEERQGLEQDKAEKDTKIETLQNENEKKDAVIAEKDAELQKQQAEIEELKKQLANSHPSPSASQAKLAATQTKLKEISAEIDEIYIKIMGENKDRDVKFTSLAPANIDSDISNLLLFNKLQAIRKQYFSIETERDKTNNQTRTKLVEIYNALTAKLGKVTAEVRKILERDAENPFDVDTAEVPDILNKILEMIKQLSVERSRSRSHDAFKSQFPGSPSKVVGPNLSSHFNGRNEEVEISSYPATNIIPRLVDTMSFDSSQPPPLTVINALPLDSDPASTYPDNKSEKAEKAGIRC